MTYFLSSPNAPPVRHAGEGRYPVFINSPGSRPPPGRRGGDSLFISGFRLGPCRNDIFFVIPEWSQCLSYRRRPVSIPLSVIPAKAGIHTPVRHTGEDRHPVFINSWFPASAGKTRRVTHYLFLDSRQKIAGMIMSQADSEDSLRTNGMMFETLAELS